MEDNLTVRAYVERQAWQQSALQTIVEWGIDKEELEFDFDISIGFDEDDRLYLSFAQGDGVPTSCVIRRYSDLLANQASEETIKLIWNQVAQDHILLLKQRAQDAGVSSLAG